ncbi:hypothetical protein MTR_2g011670 [Medicago truncatula]|uniref:Uncharacterized protein n=1 Tax=Medicago truncatula TaxID=3880 RepID=A0A072VEA8_MEDTR|nr:hypothetical protein MTR_2g011670 [Medicago truncatula]
MAEKSKRRVNKTNVIFVLVSSDKVVAIETKIEALTVELVEKNLEHEMMKLKMEHRERIFESFVPYINQEQCHS